MNITTATERVYKVSYFRPGTKLKLGFSVEVIGDKKNKVVKEAAEIRDRVIAEIDSISGDPTDALDSE